jgi:virginiamycin B lyase
MLRDRRRRPLVLGIVVALLVAGCGSNAATTPPAPASLSPASPSAPASVPAAPSAPSTAAPSESARPVALTAREFDVPAGSHPHDVSPAPAGGVWYTGQRNGVLGHLDPATGTVREIPLGAGSAPHGVITGPDGAAWITDGGLNAIVRVDATTDEVTMFELPADRAGANLNTAVFDPSGVLWFTGQSGIYGRLHPSSGALNVYDAPKGRGPYGITATPNGDVWYASLAGSHIARVDPITNGAAVVDSPTAGQGSRRVWSDSTGRIWVSEWNAGQVGVHNPGTGEWREWPLPGGDPMAYAVFVDDRDIVWLTDFGANAIVRFDPATETFDSITVPSPEAAVRQLHGRPGEVWGAESATDKLLLITGG